MTLLDVTKAISRLGFNCERDSEFYHAMKKNRVHVDIMQIGDSIKVTAYRINDMEFLPYCKIRNEKSLNRFIADVERMEV